MSNIYLFITDQNSNILGKNRKKFFSHKPLDDLYAYTRICDGTYKLLEKDGSHLKCTSLLNELFKSLIDEVGEFKFCYGLLKNRQSEIQLTSKILKARIVETITSHTLIETDQLYQFKGII